MKIILSVNTSFNIANFRMRLLDALRGDGHEVVGLSPVDDWTGKIHANGIRHIPIRMNNKGTSPLQEFGLIVRMWRILVRERPDVVLGFTIKNNIYGALAARFLGIGFVPNVTGLGVAFEDGHWLGHVVKPLYRFAFAKTKTVFFQNPDDRALFLKFNLIDSEKAQLLPGSGVDLDRFTATAPPGGTERVSFLLVARMLRDKGVGDFVEAARLVKARYPEAQFRLLGPLGVENPSAIDHDTMQQWVDEGVVTYLGKTDDVRPEMAAADCIVLPSFYREGTPRSLLEAGASARPVITTDMPGCRETVDDGVNGFICPPRNVDALADRMTRMIDAGPQRRAEMGAAGRAKMERDFDERVVIEAYRRAIEALRKQGISETGAVFSS
jgi:glycosyltransferase involved in cell wall biosynthesis